MDIRHLRQIVEIARTGSFSQAAARLGVTQPTLSKSIARLEDELGLKLFERSGSGARISPMGTFICARAQRMIEESDRLAREVGLLAAGELGDVRVGLGPSLRPVFMPLFAELLAVRFPDLQLRLMSERRPSLLQGLRSGEMDLIILAASDDLEEMEVIRVDVLCDDLIAVASPDHALARRSAIAVADFMTWRSVSQPSDTSFATWRLMDLNEKDAAQSSFFVMNDLPSIMALVHRGIATTVGMRHQLLSEIEAGRVVQLDMNWRQQVHIVGAMTPAAALSPMLGQVMAAAQEIGARLTGQATRTG